MTRDEIVEVMARICGSADEAETQIRLLEAAGYRVVPVEPTEAMIGAGYEAVASFDQWCVEDDGDARKLYRAMIAAVEGERPEPAEQDYVFVHHCDANIRVEVERGKHGLYYGTSPDVKGLIVAGDSVDDVLANVPKAVDDLRAAKGAAP